MWKPITDPPPICLGGNRGFRCSDYVNVTDGITIRIAYFRERPDGPNVWVQPYLGQFQSIQATHWCPIPKFTIADEDADLPF